MRKVRQRVIDNSKFTTVYLADFVFIKLTLFNIEKVYGSDGRVVRASASVDVDWGLILSRVKPTTLELVITAFLLDA